MIAATAKLMAPSLLRGGTVPTTVAIEVPKNIMSSGRWTKEQVKLAFHLYCQLPFGRIHGRNPEIVSLAELIGRTPDAVAMKMLNIASLDPAVTSTGRAALGNASALDREVWEEFHSDWEALATESAMLRQHLCAQRGQPNPLGLDEVERDDLDDFTGETRQVLATQRIKQHFFRRAVLSSYQARCCISGLADPRLLIASHIVPWSKDKANRLNPSNGLCLSALHDKAFDKGLITLSDDLRVLLSRELRGCNDVFVKEVFLPVQGRKIELPARFAPSVEFIARHRSEVFVDNL